MTADEYAFDCAARQCDPCVVTMAELKERDVIVAFLRRLAARFTPGDVQDWMNYAAGAVTEGDHHL